MSKTGTHLEQLRDLPDIEYGFTEAHTTYGSIGVKAWVFHGEVLPAARKPTPQAPQR